MSELHQKQFTGKHMLAIMIGFFGVVIAVNFGMAAIASNSWTGLVVKNSYVASQQFNGKLAAARAQASRGWHGVFETGSDSVTFTLTDRVGKPVRLNNARLLIGRPAHENHDRIADLKHEGKGVYRANAALSAGPWQLSVRAVSDAGPYRLDHRVTLPPGGSQ